ncbi:protein O-linked-mannose beta-1,2-N-acetylglucosaminyltransferase 1-like [Oratosquilla oratoria]|uniref:protein O-linked-mannose beta-1,2-N-acetylglucosaminyltransferase 1-like n=1 Tax=Oratosquilla oratoria TaxID=337810 RepID=UPI003F7685A5
MQSESVTMTMTALVLTVTMDYVLSNVTLRGKANTKEFWITASNKVFRLGIDGHDLVTYKDRTSRSYVFAFHGYKGSLMLERRFDTTEPLGDIDIERLLREIDKTRVVVVAVVHEGTSYFRGPVVTFLEERGSSFVSFLCQGEVFMAVIVPGGQVATEVLTTRSNVSRSSPVSLSVTLPEVEESPRCSWYGEEGNEDRKSFCETHEGFFELCRCDRPFSLDKRYAFPDLHLPETFPVVVITSSDALRLLRTVLRLYALAGSVSTPIFAALDRYNEVSLWIARLMNITVILPEDEKPEVEGKFLAAFRRITRNTLRGFTFIFRHFPQYDRVVILEDDIVLAPDFLTYFANTSWLLDADPTIYAINAFNTHSLPDLASDEGALTRSVMCPQYGWMTGRNQAEVLEKEWMWINNTLRENWMWDYWFMEWLRLGDYNIVLPEVTRSVHGGTGGSHVTGGTQAEYFNRLRMSTRLNATLHNAPRLLYRPYFEDFSREIEAATQMNITECPRPFLPANATKKDSFVSFLRSSEGAYETVMDCLGTWPYDRRQVFHQTLVLNYRGHRLYLVLCPESCFCRHKKDSTSYVRDTRRLQMSSDLSFMKQMWTKHQFKSRRKASSAQEEFLLENFDVSEKLLKLHMTE